MVISIIAILTAMSIPNFNVNANRQRMLATTNRFVTEIRNAQSYVLTGEIYGQSILSGVGVDVWKDPFEAGNSSLTLFLNRDEYPFYSQEDACTDTAPSIFCDSLCNQCLESESRCSMFVNPQTCQDFWEEDYVIERLELGPMSDNADLKQLEVGKVRLLTQFDIQNLESYEEPDSAITHFMIYFAHPKADMAILGEEPSVSDETGGTVGAAYQEDFFRACFEVKAAIGAANNPQLSRVIYVDRTGEFIRVFAGWPEELCGAY